MKNKKIFLGVITGIFLMAIFGYATMQFKDAYAMKDNAFEGFTGLYIPEGTTAAPGEKVNVDFYGTAVWENVSIHMISTTSSDNFTVYLKNLHSGNINDPAYFILPEAGNTHSSNPDGVKAGETYELNQVCLSHSETVQCYTTNQNDKDLPFMNPGQRKYVKVSDTKDTNETSDFHLNQIKLKTTDVKIGEKIYFDLKYTGKKPQFISVWMKSEYEDIRCFAIEDLDGNPYVFLDDMVFNNLVSGNYSISALSVGFEDVPDIMFYANTEEYKDVNHDDVDWKWFTSTDKVKITGDNSGTIDNVNNFADIISLSTQQAKINDKISVELKDNNTEIESALLLFEGVGFKSTINAYVKSIKNNPYFIVPFNAQNGDYALQSVIIKYSDGTKKYYRLSSNDASSKLAYIVLQVENDSSTLIERDKAYLDNMDYNSRMLAALDEMTEDAIITVNATGNPFVDKGLFELIRETRKTLIIEYFDSEWVFSGTDIVSPKSIDVSMGYESITDKNINNNDMLNDLGKESLMLTFANNGELPGKALIRLKANQVDEMFSGDSLFIYFYNEENNLDPVAMEVQKDNDYYDFYINHNSKYVLTNKKLSGSYVTNNDKYLKLNTKTDSNNNKEDNNFKKNMIIVCGAIIVLLIIIIIILTKKKKK